MEYGVDMSELYMRAGEPLILIDPILGTGLAKLTKKWDVWTTCLSDRKSAGYGGNDDADLINVISSIDGNKVGIIFVEQTDKHVKVSWRAMDTGINVAKVAKHFNGGGHAAAAGADIPGELSEVRLPYYIMLGELLNI
jgi:phosphoesterase RecJ-like protein